MGCRSSTVYQNQQGDNARRKFTLYKATSNFRPGSKDELAIRTGDILEIFELQPKVNWWLARNPKTRKEGFIPKAFVAKCDSIDSEPWYFGVISRVACEKKLRHRNNQSGAFLVRDSETFRGNFVLSVIHRGVINHYRIRCTDGGQFCIGNTQKCKTLQDLIKFHSQPDCGMERLVKPCFRVDASFLSDLSHHDEWEIDRSSIRLKKKLGAGQFGDVYGGIWNNRTRVAVKTMKRKGTKTLRDEFLEEAKIMKQLRHPKLVQLLAVVTIGDPMYIVTELMVHGSLLKVLRSTKRKIPFEVLVDFAEQIADGMMFLESKNYIHRDLAARNVLVGERRIIKIADFGLARLSDDAEYTAAAGSKFPIKWTAPEAALHHRFSTKSDVWSFGVLLFEIITHGRTPYPDIENNKVLEEIENGYRMPCPRSCPKNFYDIMFECWHANPLQRPTFETLQWKLEQYFTRTNEPTYLA